MMYYIPYNLGDKVRHSGVASTIILESINKLKDYVMTYYSHPHASSNSAKLPQHKQPHFVAISHWSSIFDSEEEYCIFLQDLLRKTYNVEIIGWLNEYIQIPNSFLKKLFTDHKTDIDLSFKMIEFIMMEELMNFSDTRITSHKAINKILLSRLKCNDSLYQKIVPNLVDIDELSSSDIDELSSSDDDS